MRGQEAFETTALRQEQGREWGRTKGLRVSRICGLDFSRIQRHSEAGRLGSSAWIPLPACGHLMRLWPGCPDLMGQERAASLAPQPPRISRFPRV